MNKRFSGLINKISGDGHRFRVGVLIIFVLLIFIPVAINLYNVYNKTVDVVNKEKINDINNILDKTAIAIEVYLGSINKDITQLADTNSLRKVLMDRDTMAKLYQDKSNSFFLSEFNKVKNDKIESIFCISNNNEILYNTNNDKEPGNLIIEREWYKGFLSSDRDMIIHPAEPDDKSSGGSSIFIIKKIKGLTNDFTPQTNEKVVGTIVFYVCPDFWNTVNDDDNNEYGISLYSNSEVLSGRDIIKEEFGDVDITLADTIAKNVIRTKDDKEVLLSYKRLDDFDISIINYTTLDNYLQPIIDTIKNSIFLIIVIGALAVIWIIIETMVVSKLNMEKQMSQLRLLASEEANQRFRIFKHDLMNHLQIIQGLMSMEQYGKAMEYTQSLTKDSKLLVNRWSIGIPELESAIFHSLSGLECKNIELKIDFCVLPQDIPIKIYDLVKIIVNLIKNAVYELENTESPEKILGIKIYEGVGEYVFEITNNVPIIPFDKRSIIFNKGFTTKGSKGNGLGLYIVKSLTEKNYGTVELRVDEEGNHFIVRLPN